MDKDLQAIKNTIKTWYETYRDLQPYDESNVYMFIDLVSRLVDTHLGELYRTGSISPEDYSEIMAYCGELTDKLKKELGFEDTVLVWDYIRGC